MPQDYTLNGKTYRLDDGLSEDQALSIIRKYEVEQSAPQASQPDAPGYLRQAVPAAIEGAWDTTKEMFNPQTYVDSAKALYKLAKPPMPGLPYEGAEVAGNVVEGVKGAYGDAVSGDPQRQGRLAGGLLASVVVPGAAEKLAVKGLRAAGRVGRASKVAVAASDARAVQRLSDEAAVAKKGIESERTASRHFSTAADLDALEHLPEDSLIAKSITPTNESDVLFAELKAKNAKRATYEDAMRVTPPTSSSDKLLKALSPYARLAMGPLGRGSLGAWLGGPVGATAAVVVPPAMKAAVRRIPWSTVQAMAAAQGVAPSVLLSAMKVKGIQVQFDNNDTRE